MRSVEKITLTLEASNILRSETPMYDPIMLVGTITIKPI